MRLNLCFIISALLVATVHSFGVVPTKMSFATAVSGATTGGSTFVLSRRGPVAATAAASNKPLSATRRGNLQMGSMAKFGLFSPAVYVAKIALGNDKLNKLRGKVISLHSQAIGDFCEWAGAYHLRTKLIKKAKNNGDNLGFLV